MGEFREFPKIARLNRDIVITEKIDGTNACVVVELDWTDAGSGHYYPATATAQSRNRIITPDDDNFGFAKWVQFHEQELIKLGEGYHYGEWWGAGIGRRYGLTEKRFSLFNPDKEAPECCGHVPVLYKGTFSQSAIEWSLQRLREHGSSAVPGFMNPEGIIVYHTAARTSFTVTLDADDVPKGMVRLA